MKRAHRVRARLQAGEHHRLRGLSERDRACVHPLPLAHEAGAVAPDGNGHRT